MERFKKKCFNKNYILSILFSVFSMQMSYALQENESPICNESPLKQFQREAEQIMKNTENPYEGKISALLSLKPAIEANCLEKLKVADKGVVPKDLNRAIAYVDVLNQAISYVINLRTLDYKHDYFKLKYDYSRLTKKESLYLYHYLDRYGEGCFSLFTALTPNFSFANVPKWLSEEKQTVIRDNLYKCYNTIDYKQEKAGLYWEQNISESKQFIDQKSCPFAKKAVLVKKDLCVGVENYDYTRILKEFQSDQPIKNRLDCIKTPIQKGCAYFRVISKKAGKVEEIKYAPENYSALSNLSSACLAKEIRVDPKTEQFILLGKGSDCLDRSPRVIIIFEEIYRIEGSKLISLERNGINSFRGL